MRACQPVSDGYVERDGVKVYYEVYGAGEPTVLLLPTWSIVHSRHWKMQIPYLARHCRVVTFDGRGNGRSDRPGSGYDEHDFASDALAVMDATGTERAVLVSLSLGAQRGLLLAAEHPERVDGAVFICPAVPLGQRPQQRVYRWDKELDTDEGWAKYNRHYWLRDYRGFLEFFFSQMFTEPHSTKPIEDCVGWGLDTTPETLAATEAGDQLGAEAVLELARRVRSRARNWQTSRGTSNPKRPSMTCTRSRPSAGWTRSCSPTSWSSMTSPARRTMTCGSATKPGNSITTCTRTPSRSTPPTPGSPTS